MKILCKEHYDEVAEYAVSISDDTFQKCLERLKMWEQNAHKKCEIELRKDRAPYSFLFSQCYEDGTTGVEGGLIYHGNPDKSMSFQIARTEGWQIHT